jgi:hypothetical protein
MTEERFQLRTSEADVLCELSLFSGTLHVLDVQLPNAWGRHFQKLSGEQVIKIFHIFYRTKVSFLYSHNLAAAFFLILLR